MIEPNEHRALTESLRRLAAAGVVPRVAATLEKDFARIGQSLRETVVAEIPAFSASGNPQVLPDLERHAGEHLVEIQRLLGGGHVGNFEFVRAHAHRRAEQRFPIESTLHAYRCGHKVVAHWLREAAAAIDGTDIEQAMPAIADFAIEYTNAISTLFAADYVDHARLLSEADGDRRTELLNILLTGFDESDGRVERLLKRAGYFEQRQAYCVVLARSVDSLEMESPARVQRLVDAMTQAVAAQRMRTLVGVRDNAVTAVFSDTRRQSGWTAPQTQLAGRIQSALLLLGTAVLVGISSDQPSTAFIPKALHEASIALDFASVTERVVLFSRLPIRGLLLHRAGDYVQPALPPWIDTLSGATGKNHGTLIDTLRAYAEADMNLVKTARLLQVHPNTLYARMQRINALTGLDCQRYHDLTELLLAADCRRV